MPFLSQEQLQAIGFRKLGKDVLISDRASIYNPGHISIGDRSRIDDFCILSAGQEGIEIGRNVHISCMVTLIGKGLIRIGDYCALSGRVSVYSSSDDFSGRSMTNPTLPERYTGVRSAKVEIGRHVVVGAGCVILPGVTLGEGAAVGAMSLVRSDCEAFILYHGCPAKVAHPRQRDLLTLAKEYEDSLTDEPGNGTKSDAR